MFWTPKIIFIHVPRTGGTVLTEMFGSLPHVSKDVHEHKHTTASEAKKLLHRYWDKAIKFAIYRDNAEIAFSWYNHVQRYEELE